MKEKVREIIKKHYIITIITCVVAILCIAPQIYFIFFSDAYSGIHFFRSGSEPHYLARIQEVYDGYVGLRNVFLEDKTVAYMQPPLGEIIIAAVGKLLFLDAPDINLISKAFFPPLLFLLFYIFVYQIFASKKIAILSSSIAFLGSNLLSPISGPFATLHSLFTFSSEAKVFLEFTKPINPQISGIFLLVSLLCLFLLLYKETVFQKKWLIVAIAITWSLSIYIYIYTWSFLTVFILLHLLYAFYKKRKEAIYSLGTIILLHSVLTIPYWMNFIQAKLHPAYIDTSMRFGLVEGRSFVFSFWLLISLMIVLFFRPPQYKKAMNFFLFMVVSLWIVINQQIITGMTIQYSHYHWRITKPFVVSILIAVVFCFFLDRYIKNKKIVYGMLSLVIVGLFYNALLVQVASYKNNYAYVVGLQRYSPLISYLKGNYADPKTLWLQNKDMSTLLAGYTSHNVANSSYVAYYLVDREYLITRLFLEYRLRGILPEEIHNVLRQERSHVSDSIFTMYYREKLGDRALIPDAFLDELATRYIDMYSVEVTKLFDDLGVHLVVWDSKSELELQYNNISDLKEVARVGDGFIIYER